ncbi:hypothetical protein EK21DRAFT_95465 [Setomelanomma holmii]|uniref:Uncharacterized protein n=1 Tax=Setomelanomma holmii TaxID=210430 RepID=A0A9P4LG03_9PLEO|nr:hypothetical protein EK21DRAFT_95465 [Setomelanomma holmii]
MSPSAQPPVKIKHARNKNTRFIDSVGKALDEVTTSQKLLSSEENELADSLTQYAQSLIHESEDRRMDNTTWELIHRFLALGSMSWTLTRMRKDMALVLKAAQQCHTILPNMEALVLQNEAAGNAFANLRQLEPARVVQFSYNHFPTLRSVIWPEGIKSLSDIYFNGNLDVFKEDVTDDDIIDYFGELRGDTQESKEHLNKSTKKIAYTAGYKDRYADNWKLLAICRKRVMPGKFCELDVQFEDLTWNVRTKPTRSTVPGVNLDETLFEGPIMLELPNLSETIFYRVAVYRRTAHATLMAIYKFYEAYEQSYMMGDRVWSQGLVEMSSGIWRLSLQDCPQRNWKHPTRENLVKHPAGTVEISIEDGPVYGKPSKISFDIASLLRLRIENPAVTCKLSWTATSFMTQERQPVLNQMKSLERVFAISKERTVRQLKWLEYFKTAVETILVDACVEEMLEDGREPHILKIQVVLKKAFAKRCYSSTALTSLEKRRTLLEFSIAITETACGKIGHLQRRESDRRYGQGRVEDHAHRQGPGGAHEQGRKPEVEAVQISIPHNPIYASRYSINVTLISCTPDKKSGVNAMHLPTLAGIGSDLFDEAVNVTTPFLPRVAIHEYASVSDQDPPGVHEQDLVSVDVAAPQHNEVPN